MKTLLLFIFIACSIPSLSLADFSPFSEKVILELGYFLPQFNSDTRIDNTNIDKGTDLNLEDRLNVEKESTTLRGDITWRFADYHRLKLGMFEVNRTGRRIIDEEIKIGDKTYPVGADIESTFKITVWPFSYMYSFYQTSDWEVSGLIGLQWSRLFFNVNGSVTTNPADFDRTATSNADAPMPVIGVESKYYITPEWSVGGDLGAFMLKISVSDVDIDGYVATATVDTAYWFSEYVGAGAAINAFYLKIDVEEEKWKGQLNYSYWGPQVYLTGRF